MRNIKLQFLVAFFALIITNNVSAATQTFTTPQIDALISELDIQPYTGTLSYPTNLWTPGSVTSATFRVYLSEDISTNFPPNIDATMESANLTSLKEGSESFAALPAEVPVFKSAWDPALGAVNIAAAEASGIESPTILPDASGAWYFDLDVTALLNSSHTGNLEFKLKSPDNFPNIPSTNPVWALISLHAAAQTPPITIEDPFLVIEDYVYEKAELRVTYTPVIGITKPVNVPTLSEWAVILLMLSLAGFAAVRIKQS